MNDFKAILLLSSLIALLSGCSNSQEGTLPMVNLKGIEIPEIDPLKLYDTTYVKLSQLTDNIKVVVLQTTKESLVYASSISLVGNKYILANRGNEIFQFSINGDFIRLLAKMGRGPGEIPSRGNNIRCNMNESMDLFFVSVADKIYLYKLSTGEYLGFKLQQNFGDYQEIRSITVTSDSMFVYSYNTKGGVPDDSISCGIVVQDWNNNLLWHKRFNYKTWTIMPPPINYDLLHGSDISVVDTDKPNEFIIQINNQDTSYILSKDNFSFKPYILLKTRGPMKDGNPVDYISVGSFRSSQEFNRVNGYELMSMDLITGLAGFPNIIDGYSFYIFYDNNKKLGFNIGPFENDYFGLIHTRRGTNQKMSVFPSLVAPNGKIIVAYEASEFLELANERIKDPTLPTVIKDSLTNLIDGVTEFSNPILVIGDMKKNIEL